MHTIDKTTNTVTKIAGKDKTYIGHETDERVIAGTWTTPLMTHIYQVLLLH